MPFFRGRKDPQRREPSHDQQQQQQQQQVPHGQPTLDQPITLPSLPAITPHEPLSMLNSPISPPSSHLQFGQAEGVTRGFERLNFVGSDRPDSSSASMMTDDSMAIDSEAPVPHALSRSLSHSQGGVKSMKTPPRPHGPQRSRSVSGTREKTRVIYRIGSRKRLKSTSGSEDEGDDSYSVPATPITQQQRSSSGNRVVGNHSRTTSHPVFSSTPNFASFSNNAAMTPNNGTPMFGANSNSNSMAISNLLSSTPSKNTNTAGSIAASNSDDMSDDDSVDHELEDKLLRFYRTEIHEAVTHDRYADAEKYILAYLKRTNFFPLQPTAGGATSTASSASSPASTSPSRASQHTAHSSITSPTTSSPGRASVKTRRGDDERTQTMMLYNLSYAQSAQQKWNESLSTLRLLTPRAYPDLEHFILDLTAVTLMNLNQLDDAKNACSKALKKRRKATDPKVSSLANDSCYLMSRILDRYEGDADAEVESRFYRSLLPADYNPPMSAKTREGQQQHMVVRRRISGETLKSNDGQKGLVRKSSRAALQADGGIMRPVKEEPVEDVGNLSTVTLPSNA